MHGGLLLLLSILPVVAAQEGVAVISSAVVLVLVGLCVGVCCCAGVGVYTMCTSRTVDYKQQCVPET